MFSGLAGSGMNTVVGAAQCLAALAGCSESGNCSQSQRGLWCCRDGSSPLLFAQRMSFCLALCDSAGC